MDKLTRWNPFRELLDVRDDFDRIVEGMFQPGLGIWEGSKVPAVDVYEDKDSVFVKAEIPGFKKEEVSLSISGDILTLTGKKAETKEEKKGNYYRKEIREGAFSRSVELPCAIDREKAKASYKDGILEISLPKSPEEKEKEVRINIQ